MGRQEGHQPVKSKLLNRKMKGSYGDGEETAPGAEVAPSYDLASPQTVSTNLGNTWPAGPGRLIVT